MYKFSANIAPILDKSILDLGLYLWIWKPEEKSPHLGISLDGLYFSLKIANKQENIKVETILDFIERKKKSIIFVKLETFVELELIQGVFEKFNNCQTDACSCSAPLFDILVPGVKRALLFNLLDELGRGTKIQSIYEINLAEEFHGIPFYTKEDVQMNLLNLVY